MTFGGGKKGQIVGKGTIEIDGFAKLTNMLYIIGLKANLISIRHYPLSMLKLPKSSMARNLRRMAKF